MISPVAKMISHNHKEKMISPVAKKIFHTEKMISPLAEKISHTEEMISPLAKRYPIQKKLYHLWQKDIP